jgi:hypothetical protein
MIEMSKHRVCEHGLTTPCAANVGIHVIFTPAPPLREGQRRLRYIERAVDTLGGYPDRCVHSRALDVDCESCGRM